MHHILHSSTTVFRRPRMFGKSPSDTQAFLCLLPRPLKGPRSSAPCGISLGIFLNSDSVPHYLIACLVWRLNPFRWAGQAPKRISLSDVFCGMTLPERWARCWFMGTPHVEQFHDERVDDATQTKWSQLGLDFGSDDSELLHDANQTCCKEVSCINWRCNCNHGNFLKNHSQDLQVEHTRD